MNNLLHKGKNILFLDIETTGIPKKDKPFDIIEVGMKFVHTLGYSKTIETLSQLYSAKVIIPYDVTMITGIKGSMLKGKPHISEHIKALQDRVDRADIIVAHNAPFDIRCLEGKGLDFTGKEVFDTSTHARRMFPELESHTMDSVCDYLNIKNHGAHRAIHDVNAMIKMYLDITDKSKYPYKIDELLKKHKKLTYTKKKKGP